MKSRLLIGFLLLAATAAAQSDRKFVKSQLAAEKHLPFSSGVLVGQTLYIAGTIADTDKLAAGLSAEEEARNIMEQLKKTIESAGMTMDDVVSIQVYCTDLGLYDAFNGVYSKYFAREFSGARFCRCGEAAIRRALRSCGHCRRETMTVPEAARLAG